MADKTFEQRWTDLEPHKRECYDLSGHDHTENLEVWFRDNVVLNANSAEAEELMSALESEKLRVVTTEVERADIELKIANGSKKRRVCEECLAFIGDHNDTANLSTSQIEQMISEFSLIDTYLNRGMLGSAKSVLEAIESGEFMDLRNSLLKLINIRGF